VDPSMDFLSTSKKIAMQKFYSKDPTTIPIKEVKPSRFNKMCNCNSRDMDDQMCSILGRLATSTSR
jgi:hypothetical protein